LAASIDVESRLWEMPVLGWKDLMIELRMLKMLGVRRAILVVMCAGFGPVWWAAGNGITSGQEVVPGVRILNFPENRSLGSLYLGRGREPGMMAAFYTSSEVRSRKWEYFGQARGKVAVQPDEKVMMSVSSEAWSDLSPLRMLDPNGLYAVGFSRYSQRTRSMADDACMRYIVHLTGLKELYLGGTDISDIGMRHIGRLKALEHLGLPERISEKGLRYVGQLRSLKELDIVGQTQITDTALSALGEMGSLDTLVLGGPRIGDRGLVHLSRIALLKHLVLWGQNFSDAGMVQLGKLRSLRTLRVAGPGITDVGLAHLGKLDELEGLDLSKVSGITAEGMKCLRGMHSLRILYISAKIGDKGLGYLKGIKSLESLSLPGKGVTDKGLAELSEMSNLKDLSISMPQYNDPRNYKKLCGEYYTDKGLGHLVKLKNLEMLSVGGPGVSDTGMGYLGELKNLKKVMLFACPVTNAGLAKLTSSGSLESLEVGWTQITISGLSELSRLKNFVSLRTHRNGIRADGSILQIGGVSKLRVLSLTSASLRDEDLVCLKNMKSLEWLQVEGAISDKGMADLAGLNSLETLYVRGSGLTDKALSYLSGMKKLTSCRVDGGEFTQEGLHYLQGLKALSHLEIVSNNDIPARAVDGLRRQLPNLYTLRIERNREVKQGPAVGQAAPAFSLKSLEGKPIRLEDYRGKVVLLDFWATWCKPCVASIGALKELYKELSVDGRFVMISISMDFGREPLRDFVSEHHVGWPQALVGMHSKVAADYGVSGVPSYFLVGPNGRIVMSGTHNLGKLKAAVKKELSK